MADRFWVGNGGNWSDNINHWSASDGGAPNASKPTSSDNVYFTANSFSSGSQTVNVDETSSCLDFDWTGATDSPTISGASRIDVKGSFTLISAMTFSITVWWRATSGSRTITTAGNVLGNVSINGGAGTATYTLQDDLSFGGDDFNHAATTFDFNGKTVTCRRFFSTGTVARTLTFGASTVNIAGFTTTGLEVSGSNYTINADTSTIKIATKNFQGGGATYHHVELNGATHTIIDSNTFHSLAFRPSGAQTITFTDGTTQIVDGCYRTSTGTITFQGSSTAGWAMTKSDQARIVLNNMSISRSTVLPRNVWFAPPPVTDGSNNVNWIFRNPLMGGSWLLFRR